MNRIPLLVISGPTASGKTRLAVETAERIGGEIINADSMQIYRHMTIGTAKPTVEEQRRARFHLVDFVDPDQPYSAAEFKRDARLAAEEAWERGNVAILCGGTGLYVRGVTEGLSFPPPPEDRSVRDALEKELESIGPDVMHARLSEVDPEAGQRIHVNDHKRIVRALEVIELTGKPMSAQQTVDAKDGIPYNASKFVIDRPRERLYEAIERRVERMIEAGWVGEVRDLLERGYSPDVQSMQALGYRWLAEHVGGELDLGEATRLIKRDTRRFAKRQLTWFRRQTDSTWLLWTDETDIPHVVDRLADAGDRLKRSLG